MVARGVQLGLRAWEFLWSLLVMALIGNIIAGAFAGNPATINYSMFCATFSIVSLFYLIPASFNEDWIIHPFIMIILDALNAIFFLCAGIALAAKLTAHSCSNVNYTAHNEITNGSIWHQKRRCREAQASTAFLWFAWAGYMGSLFCSFFMAKGTTRRTRAPRGGRPSMAQV